MSAAGNFGFKVYDGDGTRLDVLHASGAGRAEAILVCGDKPDVADRIVELCKSEFPLGRLYVRASDRGHSLRLILAGVEYQIREIFESALVFSREVLTGTGFSSDEACRGRRCLGAGCAPGRTGTCRRLACGPFAAARQHADTRAVAVLSPAPRA